MLSNDNDDCSTSINFITYVDFKSPNSCSIYILIVVDAIVQNLHLSCYTTWKKSHKKVLWQRITNTVCDSITFLLKSQKIFYWYGKEMWIWIFPEIPFYIRQHDKISSYHIVNIHQNHKAVHIRWRKYITKYEIFSPSRLFDFCTIVVIRRW